jgi:AraC family transcriptional regulator
MADIGPISESIDFIEHNLRKPIAVSDIADSVGYSLYHFCRLFNAATHHTPYDYLVRRRVAEAARDLRRTNRRVIDIAFDYQFNSPETFSRAFKRVLRVPPYQWRKQRGGNRQLMPRLSCRHLQHLGDGVSPTPVLEKRAPVWVTGIMTTVGDDLTGLVGLWQVLAEVLEGREGPIPTGGYYGWLWFPADWSGGQALYMAAAETSGPTRAVGCGPLVVKEIPALRCARFTHWGCTETLPLTLDYIYHTWLPNSDHRALHPLVIEHFGPRLPYHEAEPADRGILIPIG